MLRIEIAHEAALLETWTKTEEGRKTLLNADTMLVEVEGTFTRR